MIERISTEPHCFISVVGRAGSGKSRLIGRMIVNKRKHFYLASTKTFNFINIISNITAPLMDCQCNYFDLEFIQCLESNSLQETESQKKRILLVFDNLFDEAAQSKDFLGLVVAG